MREYLERSLSSPGILVFEEKHGTRYLVCNTREDYCRAAMHVLRGRLEDYWYYDEELESSEIAEKEAAAYCGVVYKERVLRKDKTEAQRIVDSNNLEAAYEFLSDRDHGEYEGMQIERGENYA